MHTYVHTYSHTCAYIHKLTYARTHTHTPNKCHLKIKNPEHHHSVRDLICYHSSVGQSVLMCLFCVPITQFPLCSNYNLIDLSPSGFWFCFILGSPTDCSCKFSLPMYTIAHKRASRESGDGFIPIPTARQLYGSVTDEPQQLICPMRTSQEKPVSLRVTEITGKRCKLSGAIVLFLD